MGLESLERNFLTGRIEDLVKWARRNSIWPATFGLACCAIEMMGTGAAHYDLSRWGMEIFRASPRQADLMIVAGRVSQKMAPVLRQVYDQMVEPKWVISMGVCASSGGMFNNYAIVQGVDHIVPVDMYLPGCPPRPEMLIDAILRLHDKVMHEPLGEKRRRALEAREARDGAPVVRPGAMPSSYRFDKARRAEWTKAAAQGREEQLRIQKWMEERATAEGGVQ
jgi:NADH-quinone oxidoreductase subunit B